MKFKVVKNKNGEIIGFSLESGIERWYEEEQDFARNFPYDVSTGKGKIKIEKNTIIVESPGNWHSFAIEEEEAFAIKMLLENKKTLMFTSHGGLPHMADIVFLNKIPEEAFGLETKKFLYSFEKEEADGTRLFRRGSSPKERCKIEHLALGEKMILKLFNGKNSKKWTSSIVQILKRY